MKKLIQFTFVFLVLFFFTSLESQSQESSVNFSYGKFETNAKVYVFGDLVNLRKSPSVKSEAIGKVRIGDLLTIKEVLEEVYQVNGFEDRWYKVQVEGKPVIVGYIWGGALAKVALKTKDNKQILLGITGLSKDSDVKTVEVRLAENSKILSQTSFRAIETPDGKQFSYSIHAKELSSNGFKQPMNLYSFEFEYGACDYSNGEVLVTYNGKDLKYALSAYSAGNEVASSTYEYLLPGDKNGKQNKLILKETISEFEQKVDPKTKEEQMVTKTQEHKSKIYLWNGSELKSSN